MNRKALTFSTAILALACSAAVAEAQKPSVGIAGGLSVPVGTLGDGTDIGYHIAGVLDFSPPLAPVGLRIDGFLNNLSGQGNGADFRTLGATGNLTFGAGGIGVKPYFIGGLGVYNSKLDVSGASGKTSAGVNFGLGAKFPLTGFSTFVEARVHYLFSKQQRLIGSDYNNIFIPITFGILF
jgi:hypothetical protein